MICVPLYTCFYFCIECDAIMPFDGNAHCFKCGCDCPIGDINDYSIPESEWEEDFKISHERICLISELPATHWFHQFIPPLTKQ